MTHPFFLCFWRKGWLIMKFWGSLCSVKHIYQCIGLYKGNNTGNPQISWENPWFPVNKIPYAIPLNLILISCTDHIYNYLYLFDFFYKYYISCWYYLLIIKNILNSIESISLISYIDLSISPVNCLGWICWGDQRLGLRARAADFNHVLLSYPLK